MNTENTNEPGPDFKIASGVYLGALMSPAQVAQATAARDSSLYKAFHRWTLCGDVSPSLFQMLRMTKMRAAANERVTAFSSPAGRNYAVFTHQIGTFQHRYFVPLFDSKVTACLEDIAHEGSLGYSLAGETSQAIVWGSRLGPRDFTPLRAMCGIIPQGEEEDALREYVSLIAEACDVERIPSVLEGVTVQCASVSTIGPNDLVERLARRYRALV